MEDEYAYANEIYKFEMDKAMPFVQIKTQKLKNKAKWK